MNPVDPADRYYFLHPGQILVTDDDKPVMTILGSCVALTIYSPERKMGGIFHALLPEYREKKRAIKDSPPVSPDPDYVDYSFYYIRNRFSELGIDISRARLMLFGGGDVLQPLAPAGKGTVGRKNIEVIKSILVKERLTIAAEDTGGTEARKIIFYPSSGKISVEYIKSDMPAAGGSICEKKNRRFDCR
ncbi:MAG TPA: chemotaxis protein CheD [Spirochaetota bacterium]|nr:chemotaxis protein CheD [Spirochaetota bacterium]HPJ35738.1 chemotaxis protein CheD [Spirochaetota bacterium]